MEQKGADEAVLGLGHVAAAVVTGAALFTAASAVRAPIATPKPVMVEGRVIAVRPGSFTLSETAFPVVCMGEVMCPMHKGTALPKVAVLPREEMVEDAQAGFWNAGGTTSSSSLRVGETVVVYGTEEAGVNPGGPMLPYPVTGSLTAEGVFLLGAGGIVRPMPMARV